MNSPRIECRVEQQTNREDLVPIKTVWGEAKAWETLIGMDPARVCSGANAVYDPPSGVYGIKAFGMTFTACTRDRKIASENPQASLFLERYKDFFRLTLLWYLTSAKDIPPTERLVRPIDVRGGQRFFTGTHLLPLDRLENKFGKNKMAFIERGLRFGAELVKYGDAAVRLYPLPRVPVTIILWLAEEEFPARANLFFDSTIDYQISLSDIVWSIGMMSTLAMID